MHKLGEDLGRLFEVGFNIGILSYIEQSEIPHGFGEIYLKDLRELQLPKMMEVIWRREGLIDEVDRQIVERWVIYFVQRGVLAGLNFFREYLEALDRRLPDAIVYYQCKFTDDNSLNTHVKGDAAGLAEVLGQFDLDEGMVQRTIKRYHKRKGEFLQADTLLLLAYPKQYRILAVDLSVFLIRDIRDLEDLNNVEVLRGLLTREISYLRSKSVFARLSIDTRPADIPFGRTSRDASSSDASQMPFSDGLARYFKAFLRKDKESAKLIQAGSYAYSFYRFLKEKQLIDDRPVMFNVVGYSDRGVNAMALGEEQVGLLATCMQIYQRQPREQEVNEARRLLLETIKSQAARGFEQAPEAKAFFNGLLSRDYRDGQVTALAYRERISGFVNSVDNVPEELIAPLGLERVMSLRDAHAALIWRALSASASTPYLFLTGNPGIGKTTAIVNFLKKHMDDGFLFLYISPRKQVNLDIIEKFKDESGAFCDDRLLLLNGTSVLIQSHGGRRHTVQYFSNAREGNFTSRTVHFIDGNAEEQENWSAPARLKRKTEDLIEETGATNVGVLASVCEALSAVISDKLSNNVVATVSIQSLKKISHGRDTLRHLEKIFRYAFNKREGIVLPGKLQAIARRMKHLFIMVDEVTGDESGVAFLDGIRRVLKNMRLLQPPPPVSPPNAGGGNSGFNSKIIVADASIVDRSVIAQHLSTTTPERDKIFFRKAAKPVALSYEPFQFNRQPAIVINANSYPARHLDVTYKLFFEVSKYSPKALLERENKLLERVQKQIIKDILQLLQRPDADQVIVYMQNKRGLGEIIRAIRTIRQAQGQGEFANQQEYILIHGDLAEKQKITVQEYKNTVKVIFMTSSASRGLSFPRARHLLIVMPRFSIEQNLMEIIQVIYRGRGEQEWDRKGKELTFYLAERASYAEPASYNTTSRPSITHAAGASPRESAIQERVLNLVNLLLILKTSIMTRIQGYGQVGRDKCLMVPVGGKAVSAAGDSFSSRMSGLLYEVRQQQYQYPSDVALRKIETGIQTLLQRSDIRLYQDISAGNASRSYLNLLNHFEHTFVSALQRGFDELLTLEPLQTGYLSGSLLIVPLADRRVDESYEMRLWDQLLPALDPEIQRQMAGIAANDHKYPENLRAAMRQALELVTLLQEDKIHTSQRFQQSRRRQDLYYAIPLFAMISRSALERYFATNPQEPEQRAFRKLLSLYMHTLYSVNGTLPIGLTYGKFPFLLFTCYSLKEIRKKMFTDRHLLTSNELNVINLILSNAA